MEFFRYDVTDSTNTRAIEYARENRGCAVFIADAQTAGRGRRGRGFDSEDGKGLYISFLFEPEKRDTDATLITAKAAVSLSRAIESVTGLITEIKWVNDIVKDGKKLAGILTEGIIDPSSQRLDRIVCGIGVNLLSREFPPEIKDIAAAIEDFTDEPPDKDKLINVLTNEFFRDFDFIDEYRSRSAVIGKTVTVHRLTGEVFEAEVLGITDRAALTVLRGDGVTEELISAEVSIKL